MPYKWKQDASWRADTQLHVVITPEGVVEDRTAHGVFMDMTPLLMNSPEITAETVPGVVRERGEKFCELLTRLEKDGFPVRICPQDPGRIFAAQSNGMTVLNLSMDPYIYDGKDLQFSMLDKTSLQHEHYSQVEYPTSESMYAKLLSMYSAHRRAPNPEVWAARWNETHPEYPVAVDEEAASSVSLTLGERTFLIDISMDRQWEVSIGKVREPYLSQIIPVLTALKSFTVSPPELTSDPLEEHVTVGVELV